MIPQSDSPVVRVLNGPSTGGGRVVGGTGTRLGPGDVVIIPPNTPHWWTDIPTDQIVYLVVRIYARKHSGVVGFRAQHQS